VLDCGQVAGSTCEKGPIPQGIELASDTLVPDSLGMDVRVNWSGSLMLNLLAVGGALPIEVDTADPEICALVSAGGDVVFGVTLGPGEPL
jgi:hypothetical protein